MEDGVCDKNDDKNGKKEKKRLNNTPLDQMEEDGSDKKNDKSENNYERKGAKCLDDTSIDEMEEEVSDINDNKNEKTNKKKRLNVQMTLSLMR